MTSWVYACMQFLFLCHVVLLMFPSCLDRNCLSQVWLKWGCSNGCVTMGCLGLPHSHTSEHSQVIWINIYVYYLIFKPGWLGMFLYTLAITHLSQYKWSRHKYFCNITGFLYEVVGLWLIAMDVSSLRRTRAQISCNFHSLFSCSISCEKKEKRKRSEQRRRSDLLRRRPNCNCNMTINSCNMLTFFDDPWLHLSSAVAHVCWLSSVQSGMLNFPFVLWLLSQWLCKLGGKLQVTIYEWHIWNQIVYLQNEHGPERLPKWGKGCVWETHLIEGRVT